MPVFVIPRLDRGIHSLDSGFRRNDGQVVTLQDSLQRVDASASFKAEAKATEQAGNKGQITVSTSKMGRGTDINADNLLVIKLTLHSERETMQVDGRAGRFGNPGSTMTILNREQYPAIEVTYNNQYQLTAYQRQSNLRAQIERIATETFNNLHYDWQNYFFAELKIYDNHSLVDHAADREEILKKWQEVLVGFEQCWLQHNHKLYAALSAQNKAQVDTEVNTLQQALEQCIKQQFTWVDTAKIRQQHLARFKNLDWYCQLDLSKVGGVSRKITAKSKYERCDDGQAVAYRDQLFSQFRASLRGERQFFANTRAAWNDTGVLFADSRAVFNGDREVFANCRLAWRRQVR